MGRIRKFISEVIVELKKVSWSTKKELKEATYIVVVSSVLLGLFIGGVDFALSKFISVLF